MDVTAKPTKELVEIYNQKTGKSIKKFATRAEAERKVAALFANETSKAKGRTIAETWKDPEVAARRKERTNVLCNDSPYRSVLAAFEANHLPVNQHGKFRRNLKAAGNGKLHFEHNGHIYNFEIKKG